MYLLEEIKAEYDFCINNPYDYQEKVESVSDLFSLKGKADDLLGIIRSGMRANNKKSIASEQQPFKLSEDQKVIASNHCLQFQ